MNKQHLFDMCSSYLQILCNDITERCVGSEGNRKATKFFMERIASSDWKIVCQEFDAMDWKDGGAVLKVNGADFKVLVSPYSPGCSVKSRLAGAKNTSELADKSLTGKILLLHGEIAKEQLMPKNFVFYNPKEHQKIISMLEKSNAKALICATGRNAALAGGVYPFPLIEDGDFNIPSVYMTEEEGKKLIPHIGKETMLHSVSERIPGTGYNVTGKKGDDGSDRIVVSAHIDSKKGSPGAIDNATGVAVLLLLAELLRDYRGKRQIELAAFNGEDYFAAPGQMKYIEANDGKFDDILLNINIDGAGYKEGKSSFAFFDLPKAMHRKAVDVMKEYPSFIEGTPWPQGDHSIFVQYGRPAIAVSSQWFTENISDQTITHTPKDNPGIVDYNKIVEIALGLDRLIREL